MRIILVLMTSFVMSNMYGSDDQKKEPLVSGNVQIEDIFIPGGFDDNDLVEVMVKGYLPNSCWILGKSKSVYNHSQRHIDVRFSAINFHPDAVCTKNFKVPFFKSIKIGNLIAGEYSLSTDNTGAQFDKLNVSFSRTQFQVPDEFMYAPVSMVDVVINPKKEMVAHIKGQFPPLEEGSCMYIDEVRGQFDSENVFTVLPIAKIAEDDRCAKKNHLFFDQTVKIESAPKKPFVVHVRIMDGQSRNFYVDPKVYDLYAF